MLSYVLKESEVFRLDSFFYAKEFLNDENLIKKNKHKELRDVSGMSLLSFGAYSLNNYVEYLDEGIPFIRCVDMKNSCIDTDELTHISLEAHELLHKSEVFPDTVLVSMSGTIGKVAIALPNWNYPINSNQDIAKIRFSKEFNPYYVYSFLVTKYGQNYLKREARGSVQQHVFLSQIERIKIPQLHTTFQCEIERINKKAFAFFDESNSLYNSAQKVFLQIIGFNNALIPNNSISIKNYTTSFGCTGRIDAEYYQPKYDALLTLLFKHSTQLLGDIVSFKKSIEPGSEAYGCEGIPFIRVSDFSKWGITTPDIRIPHDIVSNMESLYPKKDTILFSKDGSVGLAYKVERDMKSITSSALLHLMVKDYSEILPDYLTLVLNSPVVTLQAERDASGAIIQHWKPSEIEKVVIPILNMDIQEKLADNVIRSFSLRRKSEQLLEAAKQAVEMAIEQSEDAAIKWVKKVSDNMEAE